MPGTTPGYFQKRTQMSIGRKPLPKEEKLVTILFRVRPSEKKSLQADAVQSGAKSLSDHIRSITCKDSANAT